MRLYFFKFVLIHLIQILNSFFDFFHLIMYRLTEFLGIIDYPIYLFLNIVASDRINIYKLLKTKIELTISRCK